MIEEDNEIENLSKLNMLESLDLGIPLKYQKEESKEEDNFENEMNILLSKLNNQIETIKKKSKINFQFKPFNLDLNLDNSINNINNKDINNNIDDNMNLNINNNINYNMNNNNINNNINNNNINSNNYNIKPSFNNLINEKKANNYITDNNTNNFINNHNITDNIDCSFNENTNNNNEKVLRNGNNNNNNDNNNGAYYLQASNNDPKGLINNNYMNNNNSKIYNNEIKTPIPLDSESENNNANNQKNNNIPENDDNLQKSNNNINKNRVSNNNNNNPQKISNADDDFFEIEDIPEIDNNDENNNNPIANDQNKNNNDLFKTNIEPNLNPNENYKLDIDEIDIRESDVDNDLLEKQKEEEEKKKREEEEERTKKEEEERIKREEERIKKEEERIKKEEERIKREEEEERKKREEERIKKEEEERKKREEEEEEEEEEREEEKNNNKKNKKKQKEVFEEKKEKDNDKKSNSDNISDIKEIGENENLPKEKKDKNKDKAFDIDEIESVKTENNLPAPKTPNISGIIPSQRNTKINNELNNKSSNRNSIEAEDNRENKNQIEKNKLRTKTMPENRNTKLKNSSIKKEMKKSYTQKTYNTIRATITKVEKDEESITDLQNIDEYPTLKNLLKEEKSLRDIIPDFEEQILINEKKDDIEAREFHLSKNRYIEEDMKNAESLSQIMGDFDPSHPDLMKQNFEDKGLKNIPDYDNELEEKIFSDGIIDEMNCPIGGVESFDSFIQKFFLSSNGKVIAAAKKFFSKWRRILGDGNSFYRILMFGIFEAYILSNNLEELKYLICEIASDEFIEVYKNREIDYEKCFSIFSLLLNFIENKDNKKAYHLLLKSYLLKDNSFDNILIIYLKHLIAKHIDKLKETLMKQGQEINDNILNTYMIESSNIGPSFLIICMIPYIFNVNMIIFSIKGDLLKPGNSQINFIDTEENDIPLISFGFFFSSFYKLYSPDFDEKNNYELPLKENNKKQLTYIFKDLRYCENCEKETEHILFLEKKFIICKNCLEDHLSYICNTRADNFKEDGFLGLEYYTRPIHLCDNFYIDDLEIIELLESINLLNALCQKYSSTICVQCKEKKDVSEIVELNCKCIYCQDCLEDLINSMTNGLKYLNPIEKRQLDDKKCKCGKLLDIEEILKHIKHTSQDEKDSAQRLKKYINTLCLICNKELREEEDFNSKNYKNISKYKTIKLKKNTNVGNERAYNIDYMEIEHLMCEQCYAKNFKANAKVEIEENEEEDENEYDKNKAVDLEKGTINCGICCRTHNLDSKLLNEGGCCTACYIF